MKDGWSSWCDISWLEYTQHCGLCWMMIPQGCCTHDHLVIGLILKFEAPGVVLVGSAHSRIPDFIDFRHLGHLAEAEDSCSDYIYYI